MKKILVVKTKCPKCGRVLEGFAPSQVAFNLELHLQAHEREKKRREAKKA